MSRIRTLIVDDEKPARRAVCSLLRADPDIEVVGEAGDGERALELIRELRPSLLFLDIQMPMLTGIELLQQLPVGQRPNVIFVTAHDDFALRAFELHAVDYLMKPFCDARFHEAMERAKQRLRSSTMGETAQSLRRLLDHFQQAGPGVGPGPAVPPARHDGSDRLVVKADGQLHFLDQRDIRWIEAQGDFVKLHLKDRGLMVRMTMGAVEQSVRPDQFLRIHKSTIVNLAYVRRVVPMLARSHGMELDNGVTRQIGRRYRSLLDRYR